MQKGKTDAFKSTKFILSSQVNDTLAKLTGATQFHIKILGGIEGKYYLSVSFADEIHQSKMYLLLTAWNKTDTFTIVSPTPILEKSRKFRLVGLVLLVIFMLGGFLFEPVLGFFIMVVVAMYIALFNTRHGLGRIDLGTPSVDPEFSLKERLTNEIIECLIQNVDVQLIESD